LVLEIVFLEKNVYRQPKRPPMAEENRDEKERDPFKTLLKEALV
jgi:hypothetical protein